MEKTDFASMTQEELKEYRQPAAVYLRVMGYYSAVRTSDAGSMWNIGKRSEHYSREYFDEEITANSEFCKRY